MLAEITMIEESIKGFTIESFSQNPQVLRAVLYSLAVIGEAVAGAIADLAASDPTMPWHQIRGMRNMVIHEYFQVDLDLVWQTAQSDIPVLKERLQEILAKLDKQTES